MSWQDEVRNERQSINQRISQIQEDNKNKSKARNVVVRDFWKRLLDVNDKLPDDLRLSVGKAHCMDRAYNPEYTPGTSDLYPIGEYIGNNNKMLVLRHKGGHPYGHSEDDCIIVGHAIRLSGNTVDLIGGSPAGIYLNDKCGELRAWENYSQDNLKEYLIDNNSTDALLQYLCSPTQNSFSNLSAVKDSTKSVPFCFIATAVYGSQCAPEVVFLRKFRDEYLIKQAAGKVFIWFYYVVSPPFAKAISRHIILRKIVRLIVSRVVLTIKIFFLNL